MQYIQLKNPFIIKIIGKKERKKRIIITYTHVPLCTLHHWGYSSVQITI